KVDTLRQGGILSAIAPLMEMDSAGPTTNQLPEDQAALLLRYVVARWGADPVAWLLAFDGNAKSGKAARWRKIGQAVFAGSRRAPVILYPGETPWLLNEFREQAWVDIFAYQTTSDFSDDALKSMLSGPLSQEWSKAPERPWIPFLPSENS